MQRFRFPLAVALTSLALVVALIGAGGFLVGSALANAANGPWSGDHAGWQNANLPPELAGLASVPADQRFAHFQGVRLQLTDKDNKPLTVDVTPGTATAVSGTSLTIIANDGSTRTYALDDKTMTHGKSAANGSAQPTSATVRQGDKVVVATINSSGTATAVIAVSGDGFGPHGPAGR